MRGSSMKMHSFETTGSGSRRLQLKWWYLPEKGGNSRLSFCVRKARGFSSQGNNSIYQLTFAAVARRWLSMMAFPFLCVPEQSPTSGTSDPQQWDTTNKAQHL
jgi:hypothetical protein